MVLTNQDIVYIANDWARENKTSAHHIAEALSSHNRVLYVEAAGMRSPRASGRDVRKIFFKLRTLFNKPVQQQDNLYLYSPLILPFHRYWVVRQINRMALRFMLRRACREVGIKNPIIWIFMPHYESATNAVKNKGLVYYCVDEYSSQPKVDADMIRLMERRILEKADVVFAVSEHLVQNKKVYNANTHLSLHGVDVELFRIAASDGTRIPDDIANIRRPIAGFFGLLEEWTDIELIESLATTLPDVSFVFIGRIACDVTDLQRHPNVHFIGQRPYGSLPAYLKAFDVCLLIYKKGEFSANANPKKLREYLAGGKPVVSVRIGAVEPYKDLVYIADSYKQFAALIQSAISEDSPEKQQLRMSAMATESWESKVDRLGDIIAKYIPVPSNEPRTTRGR